MPWNVTQGNSAQFVINPLSSAGTTVIPSSVILTITYTVNGVATTIQPSLTLSNSYWTGLWNTSGVDLGVAAWTVTFTGLSGVAASGTINIIDP